MESIPGHDRWLDPPDPPRYGICDKCGEKFDNDDLKERGFGLYCDACLDDLNEDDGA